MVIKPRHVQPNDRDDVFRWILCELNCGFSWVSFFFSQDHLLQISKNHLAFLWSHQIQLVPNHLRFSFQEYRQIDFVFERFMVEIVNFFFMKPCFDGRFSWQISYIGKLYCAHKETHYACLTDYVWNISFIVNKNHALTKVVFVRCIKRDWSTELIDSYKESSAKQAVFRSTKVLWKRLCIATTEIVCTCL